MPLWLCQKPCICKTWFLSCRWNSIGPIRLQTFLIFNLLKTIAGINKFQIFHLVWQPWKLHFDQLSFVGCGQAQAFSGMSKVFWNKWSKFTESFFNITSWVNVSCYNQRYDPMWDTHFQVLFWCRVRISIQNGLFMIVTPRAFELQYRCWKTYVWQYFLFCIFCSV